MDKKLVSLLVIFVLFFGIFTAMVVFNGSFQTLTRASAQLTPSADTSLIFADPVYKSVKADGKDSAKIDVLVRSSGTIPVTGRSVTLSATLGSISSNSQITDKLGQATFTITSNSPGIAEISATVDGSIKLIKKVSVKFE